jgi:uncharacterized protein
MKAMTRATALTIAVDENCVVSGILQTPAEARACYVMAHGAGAGMTHSFMAAVADGLADRNIATLRYQFPYMERGSRRPDSPAPAHRTVRAAVMEAAWQLPALPLIAGGKSFGGRMTSQAQAEAPLPRIEGLAFFGFPLHPANKPSVTRAQHLNQIQIPMLFLQGTRDALADMTLLAQTTNTLGAKATLAEVSGADHSFHVSARSGRTDAEVLTDMLDTLSAWIATNTRRRDG